MGERQAGPFGKAEQAAALQVAALNAVDFGLPERLRSCVGLKRSLLTIERKIFPQATVLAEALCTKVNTTAPPTIVTSRRWG
jgi:hypothetical protein